MGHNLNQSLWPEADPLSGVGIATRPAGEDEMSVDEVSRLVGVWVNEVGKAGEGEEEEKICRSCKKLGMMPMGGNYLWEKLRPRGGKKLGIW